jgi:hypothetical protein
MFKINPAPTFTAKVSLSVPGAATPAIIDIDFKHKGRVAFAAWWESIGTASDTATPRTDADILAEVIAGWSGPLDDKGEPVPYSPEALTQLLDHYPAATLEINEAYRRELWGSRLKN